MSFNARHHSQVLLDGPDRAAARSFFKGGRVQRRRLEKAPRWRRALLDRDHAL